MFRGMASECATSKEQRKAESRERQRAEKGRERNESIWKIERVLHQAGYGRRKKEELLPRSSRGFKYESEDRGAARGLLIIIYIASQNLADYSKSLVPLRSPCLRRKMPNRSLPAEAQIVVSSNWDVRVDVIDHLLSNTQRVDLCQSLSSIRDLNDYLQISRPVD
jgi:hypothetical protein